MLRTSILTVLLASIVTGCGCAGMSTVEREYLTEPASREQYLVDHPGCAFIRHIRNGEIVRGMVFDEVMASWGLPNVYMASEGTPREYWIYYVQGEDTRSILIYTLLFHDSCLEQWEIDQKRFADTRIVSGGEAQGMERVNTLYLDRKRR
ncbi:MAG: hypothetical protein JW876_03605 [Candidatus Krumholzibacteriota bacterium]|nr:hypothetical protein [Candidatus Krumholzibacteriota bacterium]